MSPVLPRQDADTAPFSYDAHLEGEELRLFRLRGLVAPHTVAGWVRAHLTQRLADIALEEPFTRRARVLAVQAFRATGVPAVRTAWLTGFSPSQVRRHARADSAAALRDPAIVNVAEGELALARYDGASAAEVEAARAWLRRQALHDPRD